MLPLQRCIFWKPALTVKSMKKIEDSVYPPVSEMPVEWVLRSVFAFFDFVAAMLCKIDSDFCCSICLNVLLLLDLQVIPTASIQHHDCCSSS